MVLLFLLLLLPGGIANGSSIVVTASSTTPLKTGYLTDVTFEIRNGSDRLVLLLEMKPHQPCEEPISFIDTLYGDIQYDEQQDVYIHHQLTQMASQIPLLRGLVFPSETIQIKTKYRPFAKKEKFTLQVAYPGYKRIYRRVRDEGEEIQYSLTGTDYSHVIIPALAQLPQESVMVEVEYPQIEGEEPGVCFCEVLGMVSNLPPFLCKQWDSGNAVKFRVGENQEGIGPDTRSAGWKFLEIFPVVYGDGMYTHGEFVEIKPEEAKLFVDKIKGKFSLRRVTYFINSYYFDLEPLS